MNKNKHIFKITFFIILILFGIFLFFYGGYDDSPGAQLLGFVVAVTGLLFLIKNKKKIKA
ncbi:MAG: hypothetical protein QG642_462 [Patescibacteria group bacterium]|nr:hypothetical protein [Patescibacteria group bacterium]